MTPDQGLQIQDLAGALRRRRGIAATVAGGVFLAAIVVASVLPNVYEAWTTLLIEPQSISKRLVEGGVEEGELENRLHLMTMQILSRGRLSKIITELDLYPEESKEMTREEVISLMRDDIRVEPVVPELGVADRRQVEYEINTFRLFYRSHSAATAAAVANRLANDFIEEHIKERVQVSSDTSEFIEAELERLSIRISEVEARIAEVKNQNPGKLPEDLQPNQRLLERAIQGLRDAQSAFAVAKSDEAFYRQQVLSGNTLEGPQQITPERRLEILELQIAEYRGRGFTDKHPDVIATQQEMAEVRAQIEAGAAQSESEEEIPSSSAAQQNAKAEQQRAALRAAAASQEIEDLNREISEIQQRIVETPRVAEQLAALEREYQHLFNNYQRFSNKRLEATVAANMERRQKGEQFRILETAFPPAEPTSPNRLMIVVVGLMLGIASGMGLAILLEGVDSSFHGVRQLQAKVRFPVLASIPGIVLESDRAAMRRRRVRNTVAAVAVTCLVLVGAVAGNWAVNGVPGFVAELIGSAEGDVPPPGGEQG